MRSREVQAAADQDFLPKQNAMKARSGKIGSYRDELSPATIEQLNLWMRELPRDFSD